MTPHLTDEEIADITKPLTQGAARIRFFERLGVRVRARPNGQPLVWRAEFDAARAVAPAANDAPKNHDWSALKKRVRYGRGEEAQARQPARPRAAR